MVLIVFIITADVILCPSDSVDFFAIAALIRLICPVSHEMFPLKEHESKDGRPIIPVRYKARLKVYLRLCHCENL